MRLLTVRTMWRILNRLMLIWLAKETCKAESMSLIFLDIPDIYVGEKGWRPMPYIPIGAIIAAINMQNTLERQRREEEAKKKAQEKKSK